MAQDRRYRERPDYALGQTRRRYGLDDRGYNEDRIGRDRDFDTPRDRQFYSRDAYEREGSESRRSEKSNFSWQNEPRSDYGAERSRSIDMYGRGPLRSHIRCRDVMTRQVTTCNRDTPIAEIARLMRGEDIGAVPVLDANGRLAGIVTDRDIVVSGLTSDRSDNELRAEDCMETDLYTANQNDRLVDVIREMGDHQVRRVPVVDSRDRLVGIISTADVALQSNRDRELADAMEEISQPRSWLDRIANFFKW